MNDQPDTTPDVAEETPSPLAEYGAGLAERLGGRSVVEFDTVRVYVDRDVWVETIRRARDEEGLTFFSWLAGIDWSKDVQVGDHEEIHTPGVGTIEEVCKFLKRKPKDLIKTIIYTTNEQIIVALVRGDHDINDEKLTQAVSGKHIELADDTTVKKVTAAAKIIYSGK